MSTGLEDQQVTTIAPEAATTAATVRPAALLIFRVGAAICQLIQLASYKSSARMAVVLTNRGESVRIATHVVAFPLRLLRPSGCGRNR